MMVVEMDNGILYSFPQLCFKIRANVMQKIETQNILVSFFTLRTQILH
jgi:hypothetical protein